MYLCSRDVTNSTHCTLQHFKHYVQKHCITKSDDKHAVLVQFMTSHSRLKAGGILLPSLIEFYQWLITDLSHVITKEEAATMSIQDAVDMATKKYSKAIESHYTKLYEEVQGIIVISVNV